MGSDASNAESLTDMMARLSEIGSQTNQMAIGSVLTLLSSKDISYAEAALEAAVIARRMAQATRDLEAALATAT